MADNLRIAKNTLVLYLRMLLLMAVSLYTSRVVLEALGVDDFGVYSVVGGVVTMFSMLSSTFSGSIQRFLTFKLGKLESAKTEEDKVLSERSLACVFSTSLSIQFLSAVFLFIIIEIVGFWFLNHKMRIPEGTLPAARWVMHCSILTMCMSLLSVPYNAVIIAHERMSAFAYVSIIQACLNLGVAFLINSISAERLQIYATLLAVNTIIIQIIYVAYSRRHFAEARFRLGLDKKLFKEMTSFAGWNFFGSLCFSLNTQGINMLMNVFFGVVINAARGIAVQVEHAVTTLANNFTMALNPQITKSYSSGDLQSMEALVCRGVKFSFFIMLLALVPLEIETEKILSLWLKSVPENTAIFVRLTLVAAMISMMANPVVTAIMATGKVRRYVLEINSVSIFVFPLVWTSYRLGVEPFMAYVILIVIRLVLTLIRIVNLRRLTGFSISRFLTEAWGKTLMAGAASFALPLIIIHCVPDNIIGFITVVLVSLVSTVVCIWMLGMNKDEKRFVMAHLRNAIKFLSRSKL